MSISGKIQGATFLNKQYSNKAFSTMTMLLSDAEKYDAREEQGLSNTLLDTLVSFIEFYKKSQTTASVAKTENPPKKGGYIARTNNGKWYIVFWDGKDFWDHTAQDGVLETKFSRDFIEEWRYL